ncbi:MAG: hypothetical protein INH41_22260 [Myxococcaceae bacterium]|nr:hypothetical protein [Myxococcaceae bacterium]MCA3015120.1 hypothetical protein [Myxococcaceae bacterium]
MPTRERTCAHCERRIAPHETWYRFALALQGEAEVLDPGAIDTGVEAVLAQLDAFDAAELEAQVYEECSGVLCGACRGVLRAFLGRRPRVQ